MNLPPAAWPAASAAASLAAAHTLQSKALLLVSGYLLACAIARLYRSAYLRGLERKEDPHELAAALAFVEFGLMWEGGTALGFFSTFAVPSISAVLDSSKGFERACQARHDDTLLLMHEIGEFGPRSERGAAALRRVNEIHRRYPGIKRDDMAYTLWIFCFEPVRWIDAYDWRRVSDHEKDVLWSFWREVGVGLGIGALPEARAVFEAWGREYEARAFAYRLANRRLAEHVIELGATWGPASGWPAARSAKRRLIRLALISLSPNAAVLDAIGLGDEARSTPRLLKLGLKAVVLLRAWLVAAALPPRPCAWAVKLLEPEAVAWESTGMPRYRVARPRPPRSCPGPLASLAPHGEYTHAELGALHRMSGR